MSWKLGEIYAALIAENARRAQDRFVGRMAEVGQLAYRDVSSTDADFPLELGDGVSLRVPADAFSRGDAAPNLQPVLGLADRLHKAVAVPCAHVWSGDSCLRCTRKMCEIYAVPPGTEAPRGYHVQTPTGTWIEITEDEMEALFEPRTVAFEDPSGDCIPVRLS